MKIVIIGGAAAGMSAAAKARRLLKEGSVTIYERGEIISFGACGLPYYVGGFFDDSAKMVVRSVAQAKESGIEVFTGYQVLRINSAEKLLEVQNLQSGEIFHDSYDKLMIATGANAIMPPFKNNRLGNIFTLTKLEDGLGLKTAAAMESVQNVTVIGGGFIGIEVVETMIKLGKKVRIIERNERIFNRVFDERITALMQEELISHGVELTREESVSGFEGVDSVEAVVTDKGRYPTDLVVIATGFRPNTDFLEKSPVERLSNGAVIVNNSGETSVTDIYAAGDCATVPHIVKEEDVYIPLATGANKLGRVVGENMAGVEAYYPGSLGSACVKVMDYEAALTGISESDAVKMGVAYKTVFIKDKNHSEFYPGQEDLYIKLLYDATTGIILGGEVLGKDGAALRIDVISMAIKTKMTVKELGMMDFCYAPPFSKAWDALNVAGNVAK
ncbi:CoA-disulfide reductase [Sulfurimonas sp. HSL3-7]|uniref:CoA-disulfide reductase n=1 Tax=Sulfonitrofixus jiaomeiensis TaxID=3131938 RepID=UPI0031F73A02